MERVGVQVLHMNEGDGETSYAKSSHIQKIAISTTKPMIEETIRDYYSVNCRKTFGVADLGCSSGPNTLFLVSEVIGIVEGMCLHSHRPIPEFQVYLNDLPGNDFNTLFKSLPVLYEKLKRDGESNPISCFIAGVPGSFHGRLFPSNSLDFVHSSSSLHWLSQVPLELDAKANAVLNEGRIHISNTSSPSVVNAYLAQFKRDFSLFLKSRSEEIVAGGRMVLTIPGRSTVDAVDGENCLKYDLIAKLLNDMVSEGLFAKEKVDCFNVPTYEASIEEIVQEIEREGSFLVRGQQVRKIDWDAMENEDQKDTIGMIKAENVAKTFRAVFEPMIKNHFGKEAVETLHQRMVGIFQHVPRDSAKYTLITVSLVKKD